MVRDYVDLSGARRRIRYVRAGLWVHWSQEHASCWSTIWQDEDTKELIQIPNNAWDRLGMVYHDEFEAGERVSFFGRFGGEKSEA